MKRLFFVVYAVGAWLTYGHLSAAWVRWCAIPPKNAYDHMCGLPADTLGPFIAGAAWPLYWLLHAATFLIP